jgi:transposase
MAGRFEGVSDLEWRLFEDIFPPAPPKRRRGMPHAPLRKILHTLLYVLITGCRWCDVPRGLHWASKSATHRWLQRWQADGTLAAMQARILGIAEERGMIHWESGAVDGACSPWEGWRRGGRTRGERQGDPHPQPHRGARDAPGEPHHASPWG